MKSKLIPDKEEQASDVLSTNHKNIGVHYLVAERTVKAHGHLMKQLLSIVKVQLFIILLPTDASF